MKNKIKTVLFMFLISQIFLTNNTSKAQISFDTTSNFYEITAYWDHIYDSIMNVQGPENMEGTGYKHYMHWKTEWEPLVQPTGDFKPYLEAIEGSYGCFNSLGYYSTEEWEEIGPVTSSNQPTDDVGRLSCIEVDPADSTIVLCGSPEGGLYYTKNSGVNWINAGLDNPEVIFAATSFGLYKTENALDNANAIQWVLVLDDEDIVPNSGSENDIGFFDVEFHKSNPDIMFLTMEYRANHLILGNEILWSTNGGEDWDTMPDAGIPLPVTSVFDYFLTLFELTEANDDIMYIYVKGVNKDLDYYFNEMWKYEIEDNVWTQINCPFTGNNAGGNGRNGFAVSPVNENLLFVATTSTYYSNDGGVNWIYDNHYGPNNIKRYPHTDIQDLKFNANGTEI